MRLRPATAAPPVWADLPAPQAPRKTAEHSRTVRRIGAFLSWIFGQTRPYYDALGARRIPAISRTSSLCRCGGEVLGNFGGLPFVAGVHLSDSPIGANQDCPKRVHDLAIVLVVRQSKKVCRFTNLLRRAGHKLPVHEVGVNAACVPLPVIVQHERPVELRVDTDAQQLGIGEKCVARLQLPQYFA